jgi:hypothetical protein
VTCAPWDNDERVPSARLVLVEILSPSNAADTSANVWSYVTIPSVLREILVLHRAEVRADLLAQQDDGTWCTIRLLWSMGLWITARRIA